MMLETIENDMLQQLVPELQAEGYDVYLHPNKPLTPTFLSYFSPDSIALREDKNLVVEVTSQRSPQIEDSIERIRRLLHGQDQVGIASRLD